jgi:hypothetical protein
MSGGQPKEFLQLQGIYRIFSARPLPFHCAFGESIPKKRNRWLLGAALLAIPLFLPYSKRG